MQPKVSGYCENDHAKIYYECYGEGEPLVLLHGNGESSAYFLNQIEFFSRAYHVIAIDSRGHGKSAHGQKKLCLSLMAGDVAAVIGTLGIAPVHLLGFSDGGNIALQLALTHPDYLRSLILVGANLYPKGVKRAVQLPVAAAHGLIKIIALFSKKAERKKQILGLMVHEPNFTPSQLRSLNVSALIIAGEKDMIKYTHTLLIHENIAGSRLVVIPGGDHFISSKMPDVFNNTAYNFLKINTPS